MDESEYIELLEDALEQIPEGAKEVARWEIPQVDIDIEGKTTIIKNWKQITEQIGNGKDPKHLLKKICNALGTAGDIQSTSGRAVLKSVLKRDSLNKQIVNYCKDFVICQTCNKPDTVIIKDGRNHVLVCQACGTRRIIKL